MIGGTLFRTVARFLNHIRITRSQQEVYGIIVTVAPYAGYFQSMRRLVDVNPLSVDRPFGRCKPFATRKQQERQDARQVRKTFVFYTHIDF